MKLRKLKLKLFFQHVTMLMLAALCATVPVESAFAGILYKVAVQRGAQILPAAGITEEFDVQGPAQQIVPESKPAEPAQSPVSDETFSNAQAGFAGFGTKAVGSMIFILALILISVILLKRYMPHRFGPLGHKRRIQVLETVPIGEKRSLTLIEFDGVSLLLASTPGGVSLLKEAHPVRDDGSAVSEADSLKLKTEKINRFADTLTAEVRASSEALRPAALARLSRLREDLEAR